MFILKGHEESNMAIQWHLMTCMFLQLVIELLGLYGL